MSEIEKVILFEEKKMEDVFKSQKQTAVRLRNSSYHERMRKLNKLEKLIENSKEEIIEALNRDFRKSKQEVLLTEIYPVISEIKYAKKHLKEWMEDKKLKKTLTSFTSKSCIRYEGIGTSLIISPWNYPFCLTFGPAVSAISAGCPFIIKPSEYTPEVSKLIKKIIEKFLRKEEAAVFTGDYTVAEALLSLPFENIFFTGSPRVGKIIMKKAADNLSKVTLELGGKSPVIIDETADLEKAAKRIVWGKFLNSGQTCIAPDYVLIKETQRELFTKYMIKYIKEFYEDAHYDNGCDTTGIINDGHFERIKDLIEEAVLDEAVIDYGGKFNKSTKFIHPTILHNVKDDSKIMQQEIFGPVLPVITYKTREEAVNYINKKAKPLALYIFGKRRKYIKYFLQNIQSGDAVVNDVVVHFANAALPFGGINNSGLGKSHGYAGFLAFSHQRSIVKQGRNSVMEFIYPPYTSEKTKLIKTIVKYF